MDAGLALDTEELFPDLSQLQEIWIAEAQPPDDEQSVPDFQFRNLMVHGPSSVSKVKPEPSPSTAPSPCRTPHVDMCLYTYSACDKAQPPPLQRPPPPALQPTNRCPQSHMPAISPSHHHGPPQTNQDRPWSCSSEALTHHRVHSQILEPLVPSGPQTFKQELVDHRYQDPGPPGPTQTTFNHVTIKQEPRDTTFEPDVQTCQECFRKTLVSHQHLHPGLVPDPSPLFSDDPCVVPDRAEGFQLQQEAWPVQRRGSPQLWQFLLTLLDRPTSAHLIIWTGRSLEFKLIDPEQVARLWGVQKNRPTMNYDKLSRSLRYYYEKGILQKVAGERYVYKFVCSPDALFSMGYPDAQRRSLTADPDATPPAADDGLQLQGYEEEGLYLPDGAEQRIQGLGFPEGFRY